MLFRLRRLGVPPHAVRAKLFGGADMFNQGCADVCRLTVGRQNVEVARRVLADHAIPLVAENTGGTLGRKILFHTGSGEVRLKWLRQAGPREAA